MKHTFEKHNKMVCMGNVYCKRDRNATIQKAQAVLGLMKTSGWKIRVFENLGWHFSLLQGNLSLSAYYSNDGSVYYDCMLSDGRYHGTGLGAWTDRKSFTDPNKAVEHAIKNARKHVDSLNAVVKEAEKIYHQKTERTRI